VKTRTPAYLTGVTERRNATKSEGPKAYLLRTCTEKDCGQVTYAGQERGGVFRCGPCDIRYCEAH